MRWAGAGREEDLPTALHRRKMAAWKVRLGDQARQTQKHYRRIYDESKPSPQIAQMAQIRNERSGDLVIARDRVNLHFLSLRSNPLQVFAGLQNPQLLMQAARRARRPRGHPMQESPLPKICRRYRVLSPFDQFRVGISQKNKKPAITAGS